MWSRFLSARLSGDSARPILAAQGDSRMNTPDQAYSQWKKLDELLDAVLDLLPEQRSAFIDQACAEDPALRKEIDELLRFNDKESSFVQSPAFQVPEIGTSSVASLFDSSPQRTPLLQPGQLIAGRYEIQSRLGKGGMGEVWHAYDVKLRIDVALKSLRRD